MLDGDSLATICHQEAVANFIEPQEGDQSTLFVETPQDGKAVLSVGFVFQEPLEREGRRVPNRSQTMTLTDQLLDGDAF